MRLEVTRIAQDGDIRRRVLDTTGRVDAGRWENLVAQAPAAPLIYCWRFHAFAPRGTRRAIRVALDGADRELERMVRAPGCLC